MAIPQGNRREFDRVLRGHLLPNYILALSRDDGYLHIPPTSQEDHPRSSSMIALSSSATLVFIGVCLIVRSFWRLRSLTQLSMGAILRFSEGDIAPCSKDTSLVWSYPIQREVARYLTECR